jgi:uncharacterized caspase-like protein
MGSISRRLLLAGAGGLLTSPAIVRAQGRNGVALVIGNSKYQWEDSLPNVRRDAPDIATHFDKLGLKTELQENLGHDALRAALTKFGAAARGANLAAFYFAGHGVHMEGVSYVVPIDTDLNNAGSDKTLISPNAIVRAMKDAAHTLVVFDNCRNSPGEARAQRASEQYSSVYPAHMSPNSQMDLIRSFPNSLRLASTAPGRTALDGPPGQNSPFAAALMRQLDGASIDFLTLPGKVRRDLLIATGGRQFMWDVNGFDQPFQLRAGGQSGVAPAAGVELDKAYAFAQQNGLPLPSGLVGVRASSNASNNQKVGSYAFETIAGTTHFPAVLLVLSVDDDGTANTILASKISTSPYWSLMNAKLASGKLSYTSGGIGVHYVLDWRDANEGTVTVRPRDSKSAKTHDKVGFRRLDG